MEGLATKGKMRGPNKEDLAKMVGMMMTVRTYAHLCHLNTSSYAAHKALDEFYTDLVDMIDDFAECAQGKYGKLDVPFVNMIGNVKDPLTGLGQYLKQLDMLASGCGDKVLESIYQEIQGLFYKTQYKLGELS